MGKRKIDNQILDEVGRRLLSYRPERVTDVEEVVANPYLFASVKARISAGTEARELGNVWPVLPRYLVAALSGSAAIAVILTVIASSFWNTRTELSSVKEIEFPDVRSDVARPVFPPSGMISELSAGRASKPETLSEKAVYRPNVEHIQKPRPRAAGVSEFYPVSYTGDPVETAGGGRIIRVELKRSSLFSLGLNVSLENDDEPVQADLLVGSDGVTRAVRIVK